MPGKLILLVSVILLLVACGSGNETETAGQAVDVSPGLRADADAYVEACAKAVDFGAKVQRPECECIAASVIEYIPEDEARAFFEKLTPYYTVEDKKRRDDLTDRFFRDHIIGLTAEQRPYWNAMLTEAFPACRGDGDDS